jgi:hypothetical protein
MPQKDAVTVSLSFVNKMYFMNKFYKLSIISCVSTVFVLISSQISFTQPLLAQAEKISQNQSSPDSNQLLNGIIVAVVSGIFGFLASFMIEQIKKRNEPKKQISYSKLVKSGIIENTEKDIEDKIEILYNGKVAQNMFYCVFDIENTGNKQIKDQEIRFEFTGNVEILDVFYFPQRIEPEMEFEALSASSLGKNERKFKIGFIKPKDKLGFRFIVQGSKNESLDFKYHPKNNDDDVNFIKVEEKKVADDIEQIHSFLTNCLIAFVLLPLMSKIFTIGGLNFLTSPLFSLCSLIVFGFLILPNLESFIKSVINLLSETLKGQFEIQSDKIGLLVTGSSDVRVENISMSFDKENKTKNETE